MRGLVMHSAGMYEPKFGKTYAGGLSKLTPPFMRMAKGHRVAATSEPELAMRRQSRAPAACRDVATGRGRISGRRIGEGTYLWNRTLVATWRGGFPPGGWIGPAGGRL
jgi:hypothetical protein